MQLRQIDIALSHLLILAHIIYFAADIYRAQIQIQPLLWQSWPTSVTTAAVEFMAKRSNLCPPTVWLLAKFSVPLQKSIIHDLRFIPVEKTITHELRVT